ncbi:SDR family oxidoreductase [Mycolicibacterium sp. J2]|nr:SDR family oxidoreductase [Mycolicibacterium sp. J2]
MAPRQQGRIRGCHHRTKKRSHQRRDKPVSRIYAITGASSGIGKATAELIRSQGHRVVSIDIAADADVRVDLTSETQTASLAERLGELTGGRLDGFIACAGGGTEAALQIRLNYFGAKRSVEAAHPLLLNGTDPRVVVIASAASINPNKPAVVEACLDDDEEGAIDLAQDLPFGMAYSSAKRALVRWVRRIAPSPEWAGAGIAVNAICPGTFVTPLTSPLLVDPDAMAYLERQTPMPYHGIGQPEEIAPTIAFLGSAECQVLTGQVIYVDGGTDTVVRGDDIWSKNDQFA